MTESSTTLNELEERTKSIPAALLKTWVWMAKQSPDREIQALGRSKLAAALGGNEAAETFLKLRR